MNELHLFAGAGGGILGGMLLGHTTVCAVEIESYPRSVLLQRQRDGILPKFPIWDDVTTFDGRPWKGIVDVVCGGFPCQDISSAGSGKGIRAGARSSLWTEQARIIGEIQPQFVFVENSPMLVGRGLDVVLGDLSCLGYNARWGVLSGYHAGGIINRDRIWIGAIPCKNDGRWIHWRPNTQFRNMAEHLQVGSFTDRFMEELDRQGAKREDQRKSDLPPYLSRLSSSVAPELDELRAIGNGQIPTVAALAWTILFEGLSNAEKPTD